MKTSKRVFDLCLAIPGLLLLAPLFLLIALLIKLDDGGPVFFRQERVGYRGRRFRIWKFRTMRVDAEQQGSLTVGDDPRITRAGRWLRKFKLDELPQLINVILGEMSLVGPRPEVPKYVALYGEAELPVLDLVPGITDPASIAFRNESEMLGRAPDPETMYVESIMREKIRINLEYAGKATVWTDFLVILRTLQVLLKPGSRGEPK
ncbi:sugar transferase [Thermus sp. SYSU G05001]|uniref:Sugar transferase n=1 Tax=Thermus brevis TaxID=2862456 RepID=A0ABS7A038_9DEIN|nr:sugar transferase [Thermus brevis]MBW6394564.1 sugar transferase [Thermus brevis]